jgi:hypothetical protein
MSPAPEPPARSNASEREFVLRLAVVFSVFFAVSLLSGSREHPHRATFGDFLTKRALERAAALASDPSPVVVIAVAVPYPRMHGRPHCWSSEAR